MGHLSWHQLKSYILPIAGLLSTYTLSLAPAWGQLTPIGNSTLATDGSNIQVLGGHQSADGMNLFHHFQDFNVSVPETVTFVAPGSVENILGRVQGGHASIIEGTLAVSGAANLWLLNPVGILFGNNAQLNLQGDFTAATADAVGFNQGWFGDDANHQALIGSPQSLAFLSASAHVVNLGRLEVAAGQNLRLLGGQVLNAGTLSAPDGTVTLSAVADANRVNLSQAGQVLSLELDSSIITSFSQDVNPIDLPTLLTGSGASDHQANTLSVNADGSVQLTQSTAIVPKAGDAIALGQLNAVGQQGGQISVLGDRVVLVDATVRADGLAQGGQIYIGGNYQGKGPLPNATQTVVNSGTELSADALTQGNGGEVIVWADQATSFGGTATARGGDIGGNGGFIEISGKSNLEFTGDFDVSAPAGEFGTVLFDPDNIQIVDGAGNDDGDMAFDNPVIGELIAEDNDGGGFTIHEDTLEDLDGNANIVLRANNNIIVRDLGADDTLAFKPGAGTIEFIVGTGEFLVEQAGDIIETAGRSITISADRVRFTSLDTRSNTGGPAGDVNIVGSDYIWVDGSLDANNISLTADTLAFNGGADSVSGTTFSIETADPNEDIYLGSPQGFDNLNALDISEEKVLALRDGFTSISFGRADSAATIQHGCFNKDCASTIGST
ncbi:MAG: filamentous hemagglutinin N-terminal domain-containing protein, partial [Cyanobacteria bacterium J06642_11]